MSLQFVSFVQCVRDIPAGGGATTLAGTRRVALGAGWGEDGWYRSGGYSRYRCLCGKNRHKSVLVSFSFFFFFLCHAVFFCFFFNPCPITRSVIFFITRPTKKMKLKLTRCLFICALLLCFATLCLCLTPSCDLSVFVDDLFLLNVQSWFSYEGSSLCGS